MDHLNWIGFKNALSFNMWRTLIFSLKHHLCKIGVTVTLHFTMFPFNFFVSFFLIAATKLLLFTQGQRTSSKVQSKEILKALSNPVDVHNKQ